MVFERWPSPDRALLGGGLLAEDVAGLPAGICARAGSAREANNARALHVVDPIAPGAHVGHARDVDRLRVGVGSQPGEVAGHYTQKESS